MPTLFGSVLYSALGFWNIVSGPIPLINFSRSFVSSPSGFCHFFSFE